MKRTKYFADTAPGEDQLNFHVNSAVESIEERFLGTALPGVEIGLTVIPGSDPNSKINVGPGTGFVPNGDRIYVGSVITNRAFANTVGVKYYVAFLYVEVEDSPLPERFNPVQHNTLVHDSYSLEVLTATQWAALTTSQRAERLLVAIITGTGGVITTASIQNAVLPGKGVYSSQPVYITGVFVKRIDQNTASGTGSLSFALGSPPTLTWTAPGDSAGAPRLITGTGDYTLTSGLPGGTWIIVSVTATQLPLTPATDGITVGRIYNPDIPALTARDELHRSLVGTGYPSVINPHGLSLEDLGVSEVGLTKEHQNIMHSNGIAKISDPGALVATPNVGGSGGFVNDYLAVAFPVGSDDTYYVRGRKLTSIAPSTVSFDAVSAQLHLYEIYIDELGVLTRSERAVTTARQTDGIWIIAMDEAIDPDTGYILWYSRDAGTNCQIRWNGGPIRSFVSGEYASNTHWLVLEGIDGRRVTVFIDDAQLPAGPITRQDTYTVNDPLDRLSYLILQQVAFDGNKGVGLQLFYSITGTTEFITDQRVFGTLGPNAEADTLDRLYEEEGWAQRLYTSGVLWGLEITSGSPTATSVNWAFGKAYVGGKKFDVPAGTIDLTVAATYYIYVDEYGDVQVSTVNPSILISERYPLRNLPYALLATAISSGFAVAVTISRKAPDFVVGDIYQQGTGRYLTNTCCYPYTCGVGLLRDGLWGDAYFIQESTGPNWTGYSQRDRLQVIRGGDAQFCAYGSGAAGVHGINLATAGKGVYGEGTCYGVYGRSLCNGIGVYGYSRDAGSLNSTYGVYGDAPYSGGEGVYGHGANTGVHGASATGYGVYGNSTNCFGFYGYSGNCWAGVFCGAYGALGNSCIASGIGVYGCATGNGSSGVCGYGDITGALGYGAGTGSTGVVGCGDAFGVRAVSRKVGGYGIHALALGASSAGGCFLGGAWGTISCATAAGAIGVYGRSDSATGFGVAGYSYSGIGTCGYSYNCYGGQFCSATTWGLLGHGVYGVWGCSSGAGYGVLGCALAGVGVYGLATDGYGVSGHATSGYGVTGSSDSSIGVYGITSGANYGVRGEGVAAAGGEGVYGCGNARGVRGCSTANNSIGGQFEGCVIGSGTIGVLGIGNAYGGIFCASGAGNIGVFGCDGASGGYGGCFYGAGYGVWGENPGGGYGVVGRSVSGFGVFGCASSSGIGVCGYSASGDGVIGYTLGSGRGVFGCNGGSGPGVHGYSATGCGVIGGTSSGYAGWFAGTVCVNGCMDAFNYLVMGNAGWTGKVLDEDGVTKRCVCKGLIVS